MTCVEKNKIDQQILDIESKFKIQADVPLGDKSPTGRTLEQARIDSALKKNREHLYRIRKEHDDACKTCNKN